MSAVVLLWVLLGASIINFAVLGAIRPDGSVDDERMATLLADPKLTEKAVAANALVGPTTEKTATTEEPASSTSQEAEPGFHIAQQSMSRDALEASLFEKPTQAVLDKFRTLNPQLSNGAKPGHLVVLSDPKNLQCTREEAVLMEAASKVNDALGPFSAEEASFLHRHREEIETFLAQGSTSIGIGQSMFAKILEDVKNVLRDIELLHQRAFQADGNLRSPGIFC